MSKILVILAFVLALLPITSLAQERMSWENDPRRMTFELAVARSLSLRNVVRSLPDDVWAVIDDQEDLEMWTAEIVPFFGYEGVTGPDSVEFTDDPLGLGYIYPTRMSFSFFDDRGSQGHHHILGMANCMNGELWMNARFVNPVSSAYQSNATLAVLVHELAHIQGICMGAESEISAQLVTLEVLSSMAIKGNDAALAALLLELQGMYQDAALALALRDDRLAEFEYLFGLDGLTEGGSAQAQAAWDKTMRYWAADPEYLMKILMDYNYTPVLLIQRELGSDSCVYANLEWDKEIQDVKYVGYYLEDTRCINGVQLPINASVFTIPLFIDDLAYVLDNYQELAAEIGSD